MKVVILGSEGFVGKNLIQHLQSKYDLIPSDICDSNNKHYVKCDVRNITELKSVLKDCEVVIDLVAHNLAASLDQIVENAQINIMGLLNILEAARVNDIKKIIFPSASSMIGSANQNPVPENHPAEPKTPYGVTKLASEHYLRIYKELYGLNFVIFRFFNIYGPHQLHGIIPSIIFKMKKNEPITVFGKGDQIRDYVYIEDVSPFFDKVISSNIADNLTLNMGTGVGSSILDVINQISINMNIKPVIEFKPERPGEISNFVADTTLLERMFASKPNTSLSEGISKTVEWYKSN
ncbi:MAG: NAD-dependent epimerase/dehydratase family protein [Candidatus Nitrosotenuis sp.]